MDSGQPRTVVVLRGQDPFESVELVGGKLSASGSALSYCATVQGRQLSIRLEQVQDPLGEGELDIRLAGMTFGPMRRSIGDVRVESYGEDRGIVVVGRIRLPDSSPEVTACIFSLSGIRLPEEILDLLCSSLTKEPVAVVEREILESKGKGGTIKPARRRGRK